MKKLVLWQTLLSLMMGMMLPVIVNAESKYEGMTFDQLQEEYGVTLYTQFRVVG